MSNLLYEKSKDTIGTNMEPIKTSWIGDDAFNIRVPVTKVDESKRTVSGFATVDSLDEHGDVITAACASEAFSRFRGNIREMHQPVAVGKVVSFEQQPVYDNENQKLHNGIYVTAYISKGAQDTWEKVVDGTLGGFSIGGNLVDSETYYDEKIEKPVRLITKMDLHELSLVDNPANQLANVVSIQKVSGSGESDNSHSSTVFWCESDSIAVVSSAHASCVKCGADMIDIGWIDSAGENQITKIKDVVDKYIDNTSVGKGGASMSEQKEEVTKDIAEDVTEEVAVETVVEDEVVTKSDEPTEQVLETAIDVDQIAEIVKSAVATALEPVAKAISEVLELTKSASEDKTVVDAIAEVKSSVDKSIETVDEKILAVSKVVDEIATGTAVKKSGELGRESEQIQKSVWSGAFLSADNL